ncbi:MAG: DUF1800 domain-containing protein [Armatimonadetes bacterium]|nr:DUF1800 domain-containing protein [Armatimonadota bacterium]
MKLRRRDCLQLGAAAGAGALLTGCSGIVRRYAGPKMPESAALPEQAAEPICRLLNRAGFGPAPGEVARVSSFGFEAYIEEQLHPQEKEPPALALRLRGIEAIRNHAMELGDYPQQAALHQLQQAALIRAVYSPHQLRERMVDFWSNHFNIYALKGRGYYLKTADDREVIRRHALGRFPDLLKASARSAAMLTYLDSQANRKGRPNENYARELMELHTLGVGGGYTQKDVQEVARCLTGWTMENRFLRPRGHFRFDTALHDNGSKTVLGTPIPADGGLSDGETVLDILAHHPSAARFICGKLCRYFIGSAPEKLVLRLAGVFQQTEGDIRAVLRSLLLSEEFRNGLPILKRPFDFMVSSLRVLAADTDGGEPLLSHLTRMGQPLFEWPMPDGYPDQTSAWTGSLLARWNFAFALSANNIKNTRIDHAAYRKFLGAEAPEALPGALIESILNLPAGSEAAMPIRAKMEAFTKVRAEALPEMIGLLLASPPFQWR